MAIFCRLSIFAGWLGWFKGCIWGYSILKIDKAALFPNEESLLRLVGVIPAEISYEWETGKVYLSMETKRTLPQIYRNNVASSSGIILICDGAVRNRISTLKKLYKNHYVREVLALQERVERKLSHKFQEIKDAIQ